MIYTVTLNTAIDKIIQIDGKLTRKKNNKINSYSYDIGGKATHVSVVLSKLNIPNVATGFVGAENKDKLISLLRDKDVTYDFIEQEGCFTRESIILIDQSSDGSYMITDTGFMISEESKKKLKKKLKDNVTKDDIVVFAGSPPEGMKVDEYISIVKVVIDKGAKLIVDASGKYLQKALELKPYLIKPNEFEFQELVGKSIEHLDEYKEEILKLLQTGIEYVFVTLGKKGSLVGHGKKIYLVTPPEVTEVNDTGCGDVFVGGIVAGIVNLMEDHTMLRLATALSASKAAHKDSSGFSLEQANQLKSKVQIEELRIQEVL